VVELRNEAAQCSFVVDSIAAMVSPLQHAAGDPDGLRFSDVAILYRRQVQIGTLYRASTVSLDSTSLYCGCPSQHEGQEHTLRDVL